MLNGVTLVDHSRNSSSFSDSKHFVCLTCQKSIFNANHDDCIITFLKEVNPHAKIQSPKSRNNIKPVKRIPNVNKSERWISKGYTFSPNKSFAVHEKPTLLDLVLGGNQQVDSEPLNGSNGDIRNPYECDQTLNVSAGTLNLSAAPYVPPTNKDLEILFQPMFDEYLEPPRVDRTVSPAPAVPIPVNSAGTLSSTAIDQDASSPSHSPSSSALQSPCLHQGITAESILVDEILFAPVDNDPFINIFALKPTSTASSSEDASC
uniref:Uncharacterized protein n=1 Tax=Tanacetum cinerariifolium TaxID=118510 RepID=A0A6L2LS29_TANCI|nr:hypothetical protein [Tanacetum cinerariifolium]